MIKTIQEYQELASRTCPDLGSPELNLMHMKLGIYTEIGELLDPIKKHIAYGKELDIVNLGEEIADICWYIANMANLSNSTIFDGFYAQKQVSNYSMTRMEKVIEMVENVMHRCIHVRVLRYDENMSKLLACIGILHHVAETLGLDFFQILTNNINKLRIRYPDKFDQERAINRDLEAERKELEK